MDPAQLPHLSTLISTPRFGTYLRFYQGNVTMAARLYAWNLQLSAALAGPISVLEITVRNSIHNQLLQTYGQFWWEHKNLALMSNDRAAIDSARDTVAKKLADRQQPIPSSDDIVAATSFGLWVGLLDKGVARHAELDYETKYWQPRLRHAFPNRGTAHRKYVHGQMDKIRKIRNRIAHHEAIFKIQPLLLLDEIIELAGFVHPDAAQFIEGGNRVAEVLGCKQAAIQDGQCQI